MTNSAPLSRRDLLAMLAGRRSVQGSAPGSVRAAPDPSSLPAFVRPPGAAPESELISRCRRCRSCMEACPHDVILPLGPAYGPAEGTPALLPRDGPCRLCDGLPCAAACTSGALEVVPPSEIRMGTARLNTDLCWAAKGQRCDYCVAECPLGREALDMAGGRPEVNAETCTGCGMCAFICTSTPGALEIEPRRP